MKYEKEKFEFEILGTKKKWKEIGKIRKIS
jgi:hypothetical protein